MEHPDYLDTLAGFVAGTRYADLSEEVRSHAKYVWMDTAGVILAGSLEPEASALAQRLADDRGSATILRRRFPSSDVKKAALVNGTAGTFLELDEGHHPSGHPAIYIVPAVLALGEKTGASGKQLIEALVVAYEVTARLSYAAPLVKGLQPHGCLGVMGAAVGTARLLGYGASQVREAINIASYLNIATPGLATFEGAQVRDVYAGLSGHTGLLVADLVESGFTGPYDGLSETYTKLIANSFDPERMVSDLGDEYQICANYFKLHAAGRYLHAPLDALEAALRGRTLRPEQVERVKVVGSLTLVMCDEAAPVNSLASKSSLPFGIATRIVSGGSGRDAFQQQALDDPVTKALARRVEMEEDADFSRVWPEKRPARVEVLLTSGETLVGEVDGPRGDRPCDISYEEIKDKFLGLTSATFPGGNNTRAMDLFMRLEETPGAGDLTAALRELSR